MVRWLVEQVQTSTIPDKYGDRPYTVAVQNKNQEMAAYLKALEPEEWHNEQEKARQLMPYKLPAKLVEYLKTGPLRLEFPDHGMGEGGGALLLHGCAGDDLETEEAALPHGGHGQLQRLFAAVESQR